jgi:hypothetical protein
MANPKYLLEDLIDYLSNFGAETHFKVELTTNKNKKHRGFAFVTLLDKNLYESIWSQEHFIANTKVLLSQLKNSIVGNQRRSKQR